MFSSRPAPWRSFRKGLHRGMSSTSNAPLLLTPSQVFSLPSQSTVLIDASWVMPTVPRKPKEEFLAHRIPKAKFLDIDEVASHTKLGNQLGLKHMMPESSVFAQACETLGVSPDSHVVLYDTQGCFSSPRALFMFRAFSHNKSSVLNGGLPRWLDEGFPVETGPPNPAAMNHEAYKLNEVTKPLFAEESRRSGRRSYPVPNFNESVIRSYEQMVANSHLPPSDMVSELVLDARSRGRYLGMDPEPRPNLPSGHIPRSLSLPFNEFIITHKPSPDSPLRSYPSHLSNGYASLRSPEDLLIKLREVVGTDVTERVLSGHPIVTTCGSGMTAAVLWLGISAIWEAQQRGRPRVALYDESWTGYAARKESEIVKGEA